MSATAERELVIPVGKLVRILLVEDEEGNATTLKEVLESYGYSVQVASNPTEAKLCLDAINFAMVISDQQFDGSSTRGDEFLLDSKIGEADVPKVLVTGWGTEGIHRKAELDQRGIPILEKGHDDFRSRLEQIAHEALEAAKRKVMQSINSTQPTSPDRGSTPILQAAQDLFVGWLRTREEKDAQTIFYGGKSYSINGLINEIEQRTPVGDAHMVLFMKVVRKTMRL